MADLSVPPTPGPVDWNETTIRYTTLISVKQRLGIDDADTTWDAQIQEGIITAEVTVDAHMGRSFPDADPGLDDAGLPPNPAAITVVPEAVKQVSLAATIAVFQSSNAPFGTSGSDSWLGAINVADVVRSEVERNPSLVGLMVSWGVA